MKKNESRITRQKILNIYKAVESLSNYVVGAKISYILARNKAILRDELEALQTIKPPKEFIEYEQKRIQIALSYALKDSENNPIIENNMFVIENLNEFQTAIMKLQEKYKDAISIHEKQQLELQSLLEEEIIVNFLIIPSKELQREDIFLKDHPPLVLLIEPLIEYIIQD